MVQMAEDWQHIILAEYPKDSWAAGVIEGSVVDNRYTVVNDLIIYKGRVYLILGLELRSRVLRFFHDEPMTGHPWFFKTYRQVRERFTWKGLKADVL